MIHKRKPNSIPRRRARRARGKPVAHARQGAPTTRPRGGNLNVVVVLRRNPSANDRKRVARIRRAAGKTRVAVIREPLKISRGQIKSARIRVVKPPTPPRRRKPGRKPLPPREILITSFQARGSVEGRFRRSPGGLVERERASNRYFELQSEAPPGYPNSPGVWSSQEGLFLGQVNFPGRIPFDVLRRMLDVALGLKKRNGRVADFRNVYRRWEYKYQVFQRVGDRRRILIKKRGNNRQWRQNA